MFHPVSMLKNASDLASMIAHLFIKDKDNSRSHAKIKGVQKRRRPSFAMKGCQRVRHRTPSIYSDHSRSLSSVYADEPGKSVFSADGDAIPSGMTDAEEHVLPEDAPSTSDGQRNIVDIVELPSDRRPTADVAVSSKRISLSKGALVRSMSSDTIIEIHSYTSKLLKGITRDSEAARSAVPVRLRRRDSSKKDAIEAGFEPSTAVPRCHSTHSLSYANSQFQASDLSLSQGRHGGGREYDQPPMAVVGPRQCIRSTHVVADDRGRHHHSQNDMERYRRSLQQLNASTLYSLSAVSYSESPIGSSDMNCNFSNDPGLSPRTQRRSVQNVNNRHQQMFFDGPSMTSTPINKVAVAPQPQAQKSRHRLQRDVDERNKQFGTVLERRNSNAGMVLPAYQAYLRSGGEERLVDGPPPSPKESRVSSLEQRVRELEAMVVGQAAATNNTAVVIPVTPTQQSKHGHSRSSHVAPPTQLIISNSSPSTSVTQQLMAKEVVSKEVEIERLQTKLRKAYAQMERQQADYDEEVRRFKKDSEQAKEELVRVVNKLNDLEAESVRYQEKAKTLDGSQLSALAETQEKIKAQEKELSRLRSELADKERLAKSFEELKKELDYLELQNDTLNQTLDSKENTVKELERHIASMRMEATLYQQSCSSGSTPLADETESLADIRPPFSAARPYTKAHSTLGANLSPTPRPKSGGGLTKSLSNYAIDANCNRRDDVSAAMSRSLRSTQKKLVDSRLLVKCLKETVERLARGENPDISRLLGIKTDSMSESEAEQVAFDSTAMTMGVAEKMMRRQEESMAKLEQDLDAIRYLVQDYYQSKVGDTLNGRDDACRIQ